MWGTRGRGLGGGAHPSRPVPHPSFLFVIEHMMPLCMVISWVYSVAMTIQHIVAEKEHRLKEVGGVARGGASCRGVGTAADTPSSPAHAQGALRLPTGLR